MEKTYLFALANITNRCNLKCKHCFVFREGTPNTPTKKNEMSAEVMVKILKKYKRKHSIFRMLWMGGEPLLRKDVLMLGVKLFQENVIATNGTLPLFNLGSNIKWTISLDGPEEINDMIRGNGSFNKVLSNLNNLTEDFQGDLQCNCTITNINKDYMEELINILFEETPIRGITFTFYVPKKNDTSEFKWENLKERDSAVKKIITLKKKYPKFILNNNMVLRLLLSQNAMQITNNCPLKKYALPLYLGKKGFEVPFCCYGNDVNCDLCGSWGVFHLSAILKLNPGFPDNLSGPFRKILPSDIL